MSNRRRNYFPYAVAKATSTDQSLPLWRVRVTGYSTTRTHMRVPVEPYTKDVHARSASDAESVAIALTCILDGSRAAIAIPA